MVTLPWSEPASRETVPEQAPGSDGRDLKPRKAWSLSEALSAPTSKTRITTWVAVLPGKGGPWSAASITALEVPGCDGIGAGFTFRHVTRPLASIVPDWTMTCPRGLSPDGPLCALNRNFRAGEEMEGTFVVTLPETESQGPPGPPLW
jgi:hypothetical protein